MSNTDGSGVSLPEGRPLRGLRWGRQLGSRLFGLSWQLSLFVTLIQMPWSEPLHQLAV